MAVNSLLAKITLQQKNFQLDAPKIFEIPIQDLDGGNGALVIGF